jgi:4-amino-4-deoxy-L-arabinose transferase-like glycosyltransferase
VGALIRNRAAVGEALAVTAIALLALALGLRNLDAPSLWHDELVHVYVAKSIATGEGARLPGGVFYPNALGYGHVLAAAIKVLGDSETAVRLPSVMFSVGAVLALYVLARAWAGRGVALLAALLLATSPWHVAWARQARMYELQALCYLLTMGGVWFAVFARSTAAAAGWTALALGGYVLGMLCSFHSIIFLGAPMAWAVWLVRFHSGAPRRRAVVLFIACGLLGALTALLLYLNPNPVDQQAVFHGIGPGMPDPLRADRWYYVQWLADNLSLGCAMVAALGVLLLIWRRDPRGTFAALAFLVPLFVLTFLIGYRRPRFIYFAFPFYILAVGYGCHFLLLKLRAWRGRPVLLALCGLFLLRLGWSLLALFGDSLATAGGNKNTLATSHPDWRHAGAWVKAHRQEHAVLTTTYLTTLYYAGGADDWFPNRYLPGEVQESGMPGLSNLAELQAFVREHPRGFFLSEKGRFETWAGHTALQRDIVPELEWIRAHMRLVPEASTEDVNVYAWGNAP